MSPVGSPYTAYNLKSILDQKMLAIVDLFKYWRYYLEGSLYIIEVLNDHMNL